MGLLSRDESSVWREYQCGKGTAEIAEDHLGDGWSPSYVSRVLSRAKEKVAKVLREHANSHRLDVESLLDEKGLLIGFDYQANTEVHMVYTEKLGVVVWYRHDSYAGKMCPECPKETDCRETLDALADEYRIQLRPDELELPMIGQSMAILRRIAAKETPRYRRKKEAE